MLLIKVFLVISLFTIFLQDLKDRQVHWFLFPIVGFLFAFLHLQEVGQLNFIVNASFNFLFTISILLFLVVYIYMRTSKFSFKGALGLGDLLMFGALIFTFATISYATLLVFGLIASLVCHIIISKYLSVTLSRKRIINYDKGSVPLAGYLAVFILIVYTFSWSGLTNTLYIQ